MSDLPSSGPDGVPAEPPVVRSDLDRVATLRLNRPAVRNALSDDLRSELSTQIEACDADEDVGCIVIAGDNDYFASGADIKALHDRDLVGTLDSSRGRNLWQTVGACQTPVVAAVSGYALGGGFELALACDMIVAAEKAEFGTPEITLGIIPGGGGTQRLARVIGKQRAMEMVLTGKRITAQEAFEIGIVNEVVPKRQDWLERAFDFAAVIARRAPIAARMAKQAVLAADETPLSAGLAQERRLFEIAMATEDRIEGTAAFIEKRRPEFKGR
ncbi:MAG: enoyl-CoA hydratase/isomerase family protein [Actinobacteria bacterium]|nr:enoyl-CoA hydratase/isomerase family protein [Actinomycetota bacterium]